MSSLPEDDTARSEEAMAAKIVSPRPGLWPPDMYVLHHTNPVVDFFGSPMKIDGLVASAYVAVGGLVEVDEVRLQFLKRTGRAELLRSNDPQERMTCWNAAKRAHGRVLCIGAGIGVFQQMALATGRCTRVLTVDEHSTPNEIVENDVGLETVTEKPEKYLAETRDRFDFVYIHPWNSPSFELLPAANALAVMAKRVLVPGFSSAVAVWAHRHAIDAFVAAAEPLADAAASGRMRGMVRLRRHMRLASPLSERFLTLLEEATAEGRSPDRETARQIALRVALQTTTDRPSDYARNATSRQVRRSDRSTDAAHR